MVIHANLNAMSYSLSFSTEFFWENSEFPEETDQPCSVYEALYNMYLKDNDSFRDMVCEVLGHDRSAYAFNWLPETTLHELVEACQSYDYCANISNPVQVFFNENWSLFIW